MPRGKAAPKYLGNKNTGQLHFINRAKGDCGLKAIRPDNRDYFYTFDEAVAAGYTDACALCTKRLGEGEIVGNGNAGK